MYLGAWYIVCYAKLNWMSSILQLVFHWYTCINTEFEPQNVLCLFTGMFMKQAINFSLLREGFFFFVGGF